MLFEVFAEESDERPHAEPLGDDGLDVLRQQGSGRDGADRRAEHVVAERVDDGVLESEGLGGGEEGDDRWCTREGDRVERSAHDGVHEPAHAFVGGVRVRPAVRGDRVHLRMHGAEALELSLIGVPVQLDGDPEAGRVLGQDLVDEGGGGLAVAHTDVVQARSPNGPTRLRAADEDVRVGERVDELVAESGGVGHLEPPADAVRGRGEEDVRTCRDDVARVVDEGFVVLGVGDPERRGVHDRGAAPLEGVDEVLRPAVARHADPESLELVRAEPRYRRGDVGAGVRRSRRGVGHAVAARRSARSRSSAASASPSNAKETTWPITMTAGDRTPAAAATWRIEPRSAIVVRWVSL